MMQGNCGYCRVLLAGLVSSSFCVGAMLAYPWSRVTCNSQEFPPLTWMTNVEQLPETDLYQLAERISVQVMAGEPTRQPIGSAIVVQRQGSVYGVLTNAHVLRADPGPYWVQTHDGQVYPAQPVEDIAFKGNDLGILAFESPQVVYPVATLGRGGQVGEVVYAAGFPIAFDSEEVPKFTLQRGQISLLLPKPLAGGYQLGYTNPVASGMSGGPVLNAQGQLIAINGMHSEALWGDPYVFMDGTFPDAELKTELSRYSWGIPISTVQALLPSSVSLSSDE
ncbi:S1 family peptidase [Trichothermofontia sp.]